LDEFMALLNQNTISRANRKLLAVRKNKRSVPYLTLTLSFFALSFFGLFAIRPTIITAITLIKSVNDLSRLNNNYESKISNIIQAQANYETIRNDIPLINQAIPDNAYFQQLTQALQKFAASSDFSIIQMQIEGGPISKGPKLGLLKKYGFSLIGTGTYPAIISYLGHLNNWKRILDVTSLELVPEGSSLSGSLRSTIRGFTYYEP
jgi:hypothetical protein